MNKNNEIWKKIDFINNINHEDYEISNFGRVKSLQHNKEKILKPRQVKADSKLQKVCLYSDGYRVNIGIYRLVALAFVPNPKGYKYIKFKDGDKSNNHSDNLIWCKKSECNPRRKSNQYIKLDKYSYKLIIDNTHEIIFDLEDYDIVSSYHWKINRYGYAYSGNIAMHRIILNNPKGIVDHIDHNKLNNKKVNLRICSIMDNAHNKDNKKAKYGVYGVYPVLCKWNARIGHNGIMYNLGTFDTYEEAALARIKKEIELFGEYSGQKHLLSKYENMTKG